MSDVRVPFAIQPFVYLNYSPPARCVVKGRRKAVEQLEEAAERLRAEGDGLEEEVEGLLGQAAR